MGWSMLCYAHSTRATSSFVMYSRTAFVFLYMCHAVMDASDNTSISENRIWLGTARLFARLPDVLGE